MKQLQRLFVMMAILAALATTQINAELNAKPPLALLGHLGGPSLSVAVQDSYAYLALGHELAVIDISDPQHPQRVGFAILPAYDLAVQGDFAYVVSRDSLRIVSIADPQNPHTIGQMAVSYTALGIAVKDNRAYLANEWGGLLIVDVSNPRSSQLISSIDTIGTAWDVAISGDYALVAGNYNGLTIVDVPALRNEN